MEDIEMSGGTGKRMKNRVKASYLTAGFMIVTSLFIPPATFGQQGPGKLIALLVTPDAASQYGSFQKGETINIPKALLSALDSQESPNSIIYLVTVNDLQVRTPFYIISTRRLKMTDLQFPNTIFENLTLVYTGNDTYSSSGVQRETFVFRTQDSQLTQPSSPKPVRDKSIVEALLKGAEGGNTAMVQAALDSGIDPNATQEKGNAGYNREIQRGRWLGGVTALMYASINNRVDMVKMLLGAGAGIDQKASDGSTALYLATQFGYVPIVKILLDKGANPNLSVDSGLSAMAVAVSQGNSDLLKILLAAKADLNWKSRGGETLLMAARGGDINVVRALIDSGADINAKDSKGMTVLVSASMKKKNEEVVKLLLNSGAKPNVAYGGGYTALMNAITNNNFETIKLLVAFGADVNIVNERGETAIFGAIESGSPEYVKELLSAKANVNLKNSKDLTPLMIAIDRVHRDLDVQIVKLLLEAGADVNTTTSSEGGSTALMRAKLKGNAPLLKLLDDFKVK